MTVEDIVPLLLTISAIMLAPRRLFDRPWFEVMVVGLLGILLCRYLLWRFFVTVLPADPVSIEGAVVWLIFAIEFLTWIDAAILFAFLVARTNRSAEADINEQRLRCLDPSDLPTVDVFIATFNEPPEVLEKTITGAMAMDWPADRLNIWILDDGKRPWREQEAARRKIGYLTRADNKGAKAGNINAAIARTQAPFFLVLDADFIPQQSFLFRAIGFFDDPRIGIVQIPHNFFNPDPMQTSLNMSKVMPDDQRFFFEAIMPGRDGYDCAFCCGSNGIVRRSAMEEIGNALPTGSITEDMLLTLALKRKGYVTRYLNEPLAFGLAPESINAFFIQRARWARGGLQIMFLDEGPLGRSGLALHERLFFFPLHWITQSLGQTVAMITPILFLLTGIPPLVNTTVAGIFSYQVPTILATVAAVRLFAPGSYHPLASTSLAVLQAFRLLPVVLSTLIKPHGHAFKVTPKGSSGAVVQDNVTVFVSIGLAFLTGMGLLLNAIPETQIVPFSHLMPIVAFWSVLNMIVLLLVARIAVSPPASRSEERFTLNQKMILHTPRFTADVCATDMSLSGVALKSDGPLGLEPGAWVGLEIAEVGLVAGRVARVSKDGMFTGVSFAVSGLATRIRRSIEPVEDPADAKGTGRPKAQDRRDDGAPDPDAVEMALRDRLIRVLFTKGRSGAHVTNEDGWRISWTMLAQIFGKDPKEIVFRSERDRPEEEVPDWLLALVLANAPAPDRTGSAEQAA